MYNDFYRFGLALEELNDNISRILVLKDYSLKGEVINTNVASNFFSSNYTADKLSKYGAHGVYDRIYFDVNDVIKNILSDRLITSSEEKYLNTMYDYNYELIKEYKNILGDLYDKYDYDKFIKMEKNIINIYNNYSKAALNLINSDKYSFLKNYAGDFLAADFENVKNYCEEVFLKLAGNKPLKQDTSLGENYDAYIFKTNLSNKNNIFNEAPEYKVEFNKSTKEVWVQAVSYTVEKSGQTEGELDSLAAEIISGFNSDAVMYEKNIRYDENKKINYITYSYIERNKHVFDETKKIELTLQKQGILTDFKIVYPFNEEIVLPDISEDAIIDKVNNKGKILEVLLIRNIKGKVEYEVHLKYNETPYAVVFDGTNGELKYYGREIRNYSGVKSN